MLFHFPLIIFFVRSFSFRSTQIKTYSWDDAQVILVGNKCDMEDERVVSTERGRHLGEQLGKSTWVRRGLRVVGPPHREPRLAGGPSEEGRPCRVRGFPHRWPHQGPSTVQRQIGRQHRGSHPHP